MDKEILEILKSMQESIQRVENKVDKIEMVQQEIKEDIKDIKLDIGSIKINVKETREDAIRHIQKNNKSICQHIFHQRKLDSHSLAE